MTVAMGWNARQPATLARPPRSDKQASYTVCRRTVASFDIDMLYNPVYSSIIE